MIEMTVNRLYLVQGSGDYRLISTMEIPPPLPPAEDVTLPILCSVKYVAG